MPEPERISAVQRDELRVPHGTTIFREGDCGDSMFVIECGQVRIVFSLDGRPAEVAVLEPGDFFGELSLLSGAPRTATAEAVGDTVLLVIRRETFAMMMQDDLEIVFRMLSQIGRRLARTDEQFRRLMQRLGRVGVLAECVRRAAQGDKAPPIVIDLERLGDHVAVGPTELQTTVADLAAQGAGTVRDGRLVLESREQVERLTEVLCRSAQGRAAYC